MVSTWLVSPRSWLGQYQLQNNISSRNPIPTKNLALGSLDASAHRVYPSSPPFEIPTSFRPDLPVVPFTARTLHHLLGMQMGDVHDVRKENVCRGSSPENVCAYRRRVRDRLHGERLRQRAARGLPSRQPPRIRAVTSRADIPSAAAKPKKCLSTDYINSDGAWGNERVGGAGHAADNSGEQGNDESCWREPYLMFVKAKTGRSQDGKTTRGMSGSMGIVPFCSECLGCCNGTCSPGGTPEMERSDKSEGGEHQTTKLAHHEQQRAKGKTSPRSPQQPTIQVVLPGEASGVGGSSDAPPDVDERR